MHNPRHEEGGVPRVHHTPIQDLEKLVSNHIPQLQTLVIWSDTLAELDVSSSKELFKCELYCPKLRDPKIPPIRRKRVDEEQQLPDIADILKRDYQIEARKEAELKEHQASIVEVGHTLSKLGAAAVAAAADAGCFCCCCRCRLLLLLLSLLRLRCRFLFIR